MRKLENVFETKDESKFKAATEAYATLYNDINYFSERHVKFGFDLLNFEKAKYYNVIKPANPEYFSVVYSNIYEFCAQEFGLKKRACANHIAVAKNFADKCGVVKEEYKEYSFSQLVVMVAVLKFNPAVRERFKPSLKVKDMELLVKAVKHETLDLGKSDAWNINRINEYLEAKKAEKSEQAKANIESVEEKYEKEDKITAEGELIEGIKEEVHITAPCEQSEMRKRIKRALRGLSVKKGDKPLTMETVVGNIIKEIYEE